MLNTTQRKHARDSHAYTPPMHASCVQSVTEGVQLSDSLYKSDDMM